jgi:hypothetical protein
MTSEKPTVYQCIAAVAADIAKEGIAKGKRNTQQGYQFRGIDDVYNALAPILSRHGLVIIPRCIARSVAERQTQKGGVLFYVTVEAEFDFVSAADGSKVTARTFGEAMDSADKATNKAMSAAYKYAAFQTFCIPTEGDNDADATTHEVAPAKAAPDVPRILAGIAGSIDMDILRANYEAAMQMLPENHHQAIKKATNARKHELQAQQEQLETEGAAA